MKIISQQKKVETGNENNFATNSHFHFFPTNNFATDCRNNELLKIIEVENCDYLENGSHNGACFDVKNVIIESI